MTTISPTPFIALATRWPDRPAIQAPDISLTFSQLVGRASRIAELLKRRGIGIGDRVGIAQTNTTQAFLLMLGSMAVRRDRPGDRFPHARPRTQKARRQSGYQILCRGSPRPGRRHLRGGPQRRCVGRGGGTGQPKLPCRRPGLDNPIAVIGVSSGTSGLPQPVALSHSCLYTRAALVVTSPQWVRGCRLIATAPLSFTATRMNVLSCLLDGGSVYFAPILISSEQLAETIVSSKRRRC